MVIYYKASLLIMTLSIETSSLYKAFISLCTPKVFCAKINIKRCDLHHTECNEMWPKINTNIKKTTSPSVTHTMAKSL